MHKFHIPQCSIQNRNVHISVLNGALWDMELVHSGICKIGLMFTLQFEFFFCGQPKNILQAPHPDSTTRVWGQGLMIYVCVELYVWTALFNWK